MARHGKWHDSLASFLLNRKVKEIVCIQGSDAR